MRPDARAAILAVDGGNSKADAALVAADGVLLSAVRGPTISHQAVDLEQAMLNLRASVDAALREAASSRGPVWDAGRSGADVGPGGGAIRRGGPEPGARGVGTVARLGIYALAGADYPSDVRLLRTAIGRLGLTDEVVILNDTFAALRSGTTRRWGLVLICGRGINAAAVAPNGRSARFDAVGPYSGDWGGGLGIGMEGHSAAVRAFDGRGPRTTLERLVPEHFGLQSPRAVIRALYERRIELERLAELTPVVFEAATAGDPVARSIVDRMADELVAMARALLRRLRMTRLDPEVVLAGGVFRTRDQGFYERLELGLHAVAPSASIVRPKAPPILGSALIGLDRLDAGSGAAARVTADIEAWAANGAARLSTR